MDLDMALMQMTGSTLKHIVRCHGLGKLKGAREDHERLIRAAVAEEKIGVEILREAWRKQEEYRQTRKQHRLDTVAEHLDGVTIGSKVFWNKWGNGTHYGFGIVTKIGASKVTVYEYESITLSSFLDCAYAGSVVKPDWTTLKEDSQVPVTVKADKIELIKDIEIFDEHHYM